MQTHHLFSAMRYDTTIAAERDTPARQCTSTDEPERRPSVMNACASSKWRAMSSSSSSRTVRRLYAMPSNRRIGLRGTHVRLSNFGQEKKDDHRTRVTREPVRARLPETPSTTQKRRIAVVSKTKQFEKSQFQANILVISCKCSSRGTPTEATEQSLRSSLSTTAEKK